MSTAQTGQSSSRLALLDLARALAVLFMIQGHSLDVLLDAVYRQGPVFNTWLFLRGLTAPTFFTLAGMSFTVASLKYWDSYIHFSARLFRRIRRYVFFIGLGYLIHFPVRHFHDFRYLGAAGWQGFLEVDVLQCVGLTLVFLQLLIWAAKTPRRFAAISLALCAGVILLTPVFSGVDWTRHLPLLPAALLNSRTGSFFALFPWSGFIFLGAAAGYAYTRWWTDSVRMPMRTLAAGGTTALTGFMLSKLPAAWHQQSNAWFLIRVGCVCCLLSLLSFATRRVNVSNPIISALARESLTVYLIHACILYGSIWNIGMRQVVGPHLTPIQCVKFIFLLLLSMMMLAWSWNWYKRNESKNLRMARMAMMCLTVLYTIA